MNVLWIVNIIFPEAESLMTSKTSLKSSGGWLLGLADQIVKQPDVKLTVATVSKRVKAITRLNGEYITYYILPLKGYDKMWDTVKAETDPDVIHLHGTEYPWGASYVNQCGGERVVVSIQGLLSSYYYYYYYGLNTFDIIRNFTFGDLISGGPLGGKRRFKKGAKREINLLKNVTHVIGRTSWDRARTWAINPDATYHFCNEILRAEFYQDERWEYETCNAHTIFLSQASYPIKGLHQVLRALPLVLRHYPDTVVRIAGWNITYKKGWRARLLFGSYSKIICKMIKKYDLEDHINFIGPKNADEMKLEYLKCNVFVSPSTIENSPNSLGEAQILGVPCISSYVGGTHDMIPNKDCGTLYRFEETEMLARAICDVFAKIKINNNSIIRIAKERHDAIKNTTQLLQIYKLISQDTRLKITK